MSCAIHRGGVEVHGNRKTILRNNRHVHRADGCGAKRWAVAVVVVAAVVVVVVAVAAVVVAVVAAVAAVAAVGAGSSVGAGVSFVTRPVENPRRLHNPPKQVRRIEPGCGSGPLWISRYIGLLTCAP